MNLQVLGSREALVALVARVGALVRVRAHVHEHFVPGDKINLDYSFCLLIRTRETTLQKKILFLLLS